MTVAELIAKLQEMPGDLPVWTETDGLHYEVEEARQAVMQHIPDPQGRKGCDYYGEVYEGDPPDPGGRTFTVLFID